MCDSNISTQAIGRNCNQMQALNLGWCDNVGDVGVMSLAFGCPDLRVLDLCGCLRITGTLRYDGCTEVIFIPWDTN